MGHCHRHVPAWESPARGLRLLVALALNLGIAAAELVGGIISDSLALIQVAHGPQSPRPRAITAISVVYHVRSHRARCSARCLLPMRKAQTRGGLR